MSFRFVKITLEDGLPSLDGEGHAAFGLAVPDEHGDESGIAANWLWDGERLEVTSDRHGYMPLYYHFEDATGTLRVSDSPLELLADGVSADLDVDSLGFFCRAGFLLGDRSLYRNIQRVPAGSILSWYAGRIDVRSVENRFQLESPSSIDEALEGWIDRFRTAISRRQPSGIDFAMPLSGGRDSRMILMELRSLGHEPVEVVSFGPGLKGENEDLRIARRIARRLDIPHAIARSTRSWLEVEHERHAWCGCEAIEHSWLMGLWRYFRENHRCWYDGLGSGAMTRGELNTPDMLEHLRAGATDEFCNRFFERTAAPTESWIQRIAEATGRDIPNRDSTVELVREELDRHAHAPNPLGLFSFCNWGRRAIALNPYGICRSVAEVHTPFMDRDLVDWVASVPAEWTFENDLQTEASLRLHPELADIEFDAHASASMRGPGVRRRFSNWMDRNRFFSGPGKAFKGISAQAMREKRTDPSANRALTLMVHLVLADASTRPEEARKLLGHASEVEQRENHPHRDQVS